VDSRYFKNLKIAISPHWFKLLKGNLAA